MLPERWRAALPVVAAVAVVAALSLVTVTVMSSFGSDDDDDRAFVDADDSTTTTTDSTTRRTPPRPTTTTTSPPEVLAETTERDPDAPSPTTVVPAGAPAAAPTPGPGAPAPSPNPPAPTPTSPPTSSPPPTSPPTTICRNSYDPSCGAFSWSPQPGPYEVEVLAVSTPATATVGEPVTFAVDYIDPAGASAQGACPNWFVSDPAVVNTSSCQTIATDCSRTGPHDPPPRSREWISLERTIVFETPGTHQVRISGNVGTHLADGCESPYRNTFSETFTITVS